MNADSTANIPVQLVDCSICNPSVDGELLECTHCASSTNDGYQIVWSNLFCDELAQLFAHLHHALRRQSQIVDYQCNRASWNVRLQRYTRLGCTIRNNCRLFCFSGGKIRDVGK